jgi:hypothetical protein
MTYTGGGAISVAIVDTGNNISANLAVLEAAIQEANPTIASIAVTGSEPINVTIHQLNVDSSVFSALAAGGSSYELDVSDTSGNISGAIDTLGALASSGNWPVPGLDDTELGVRMEPEVWHGTKEVYAGVQA